VRPADLAALAVADGADQPMAGLVGEVARTFNVHPATIYRCIEMPVLRPRPRAL
jgi:hypothetical protein